MTSTASSHPHGMEEEAERMCRVAAAVAMIERGSPDGGKVSLRRAADYFKVPKSTVHRHIQANRGIIPPPRRRPSPSSSTQSSNSSPVKRGKCDISYLVHRHDLPNNHRSNRGNSHSSVRKNGKSPARSKHSSSSRKPSNLFAPLPSSYYVQ